MSERDNITVHIPASIELARMFGTSDRFLRRIQDEARAHIYVRGNAIDLEGDATETHFLKSLFLDMVALLEMGGDIDDEYLERALSRMRDDESAPIELRKDVLLTYRGKSITPKTPGQKAYCDAIRANTVTFGLGPAGTGKTYLAVALALRALQEKEVGRIVLTRPVVEAGENLGFLPGTLREKIDPYMRPLYDAIFSMYDITRANRLIDEGTIEVAPLAFMRGRTLNDSFVILDEAQNATPEQLKMFLTRLGFATKMVVTGDMSQSDIPRGASGLRGIRSILGDVDDIAFVELDGHDVVRASLVAEIVAAYERAEKRASEPAPKE